MVFNINILENKKLNITKLFSSRFLSERKKLIINKNINIDLYGYKRLRFRIKVSLCIKICVNI